VRGTIGGDHGGGLGGLFGGELARTCRICALENIGSNVYFLGSLPTAGFDVVMPKTAESPLSDRSPFTWY